MYIEASGREESISFNDINYYCVEFFVIAAVSALSPAPTVVPRKIILRSDGNAEADNKPPDNAPPASAP